MHVTLETCIDRNEKRDRTVPADILRSYVERLDTAVTDLRDEPGLIDEFIAVNNNRNVEHETEADRWGHVIDKVQSANRVGKSIFESNTIPSALPNMEHP